MPTVERLIYTGEKFSIEWYFTPNGRSQAKEYYDGLALEERAKAMALFKRMADFGQIFDSTKFTKETEKLYVFKPQPHRFFCFFVKGRRIFVVSAYQKQSKKTPPREIERAEDMRRQYLARMKEGNYYGDET
ncbi:MAG TPA: type II toxin-antitoxin system RelE/ParE family toxin [Spirochaetia bacterium]|nr:type II toxin-antitoxin system RelE/ParE family toxin [Spirochaetia bacterium]